MDPFRAWSDAHRVTMAVQKKRRARFGAIDHSDCASISVNPNTIELQAAHLCSNKIDDSAFLAMNASLAHKPLCEGNQRTIEHRLSPKSANPLTR
jgi:hypothetical protein